MGQAGGRAERGSNHAILCFSSRMYSRRPVKQILTDNLQPPGLQKSNEQVIRDVVAAAGRSEATFTMIKAQITWWDGSGDGKRPCSMTGGGVVSGGRLGRD